MPKKKSHEESLSWRKMVEMANIRDSSTEEKQLKTTVLILVLISLYFFLACLTHQTQIFLNT
jgi:hypothetical protein